MYKKLKKIYISIFPIITVAFMYAYDVSAEKMLNRFETYSMPMGIGINNSTILAVIYSIIFVLYLYLLLIDKEKVSILSSVIGVVISVMCIFLTLLPIQISKYIFMSYTVSILMIMVLISTYALNLILIIKNK